MLCTKVPWSAPWYHTMVVLPVWTDTDRCSATNTRSISVCGVMYVLQYEPLSCPPELLVVQLGNTSTGCISYGGLHALASDRGLVAFTSYD